MGVHFFVGIYCDPAVVCTHASLCAFLPTLQVFAGQGFSASDKKCHYNIFLHSIVSMTKVTPERYGDHATATIYGDTEL